jgi:hypothetical protein
MVLEYDHPLKKLTEEFGPHTKAIFPREWRISQVEVFVPIFDIKDLLFPTGGEWSPPVFALPLCPKEPGGRAVAQRSASKSHQLPPSHD